MRCGCSPKERIPLELVGIERRHVDGQHPRRTDQVARWRIQEAQLAYYEQEGVEREVGEKGEGRTMFVAIVSRLILAPVLVLPTIAALAYYDLQRVTNE